MKDNLNIEKLFKDKFENFEGNVNPNLWANISSGISNSAATSVGVSLGVKALIVSASVAAISVATYFIGGFNENKPTEPIINHKAIVNVTEKITEQKKETVIIAENNDPIIIENKAEIVKKLNQSLITNTDKPTKTEVIKEVTNINESTVNSVQTTTNSSVNLSNSSKKETESKTTEIELIAKNNSQNKETTTQLVYPTGKLEYKTVTKFQYSFKANAFDSESIRWDFGDGQFSTKENPIHTYASAGKYNVSLTLISKDNEMYQEVKIIDIKTTSSIDNIPNVITPNGDRINDEFIIKTTNIKSFKIIINTQMGTKVFESNDKDFSWDGKDLNGNTVEKAVYIYYIFAKGTDGSIFKIPGQLYVR